MKKPESEGGYGAKKGTQVFYAAANKGAIEGVEKKSGKRKGKK